MISTVQTINIRQNPHDGQWYAMVDGDGRWVPTCYFGVATFDNVCDGLKLIHPNAFFIEG